LECTVVDSIKDVEKIWGLEELLNCLYLVPFIDEVKLKTYLDFYKIKALYQKAGHLLENFDIWMQLNKEVIEYCRHKMGKSTRYLIEEAKNKGVYSKEWRLIVPEAIFDMSLQGSGQLV
jgi:predicted transcriptional regulator of viral defense system